MSFHSKSNDVSDNDNGRHSSQDSWSRLFISLSRLSSASAESFHFISPVQTDYLKVPDKSSSKDLPDIFDFNNSFLCAQQPIPYDNCQSLFSPLHLSLESKGSIDSVQVCLGNLPVFPRQNENGSCDACDACDTSSNSGSIVLPSFIGEMPSESYGFGEITTEFGDTYDRILTEDMKHLNELPVMNDYPMMHSTPTLDIIDSCFYDSCPFSMRDINQNPSDDDYRMEVEESEMEIEQNVEPECEAGKRSRTNHTWAETASKLQLNISTNEMSSYSIPDQWLSAHLYFSLLSDAENNVSPYPLYDLGCDSKGATFHPSFIYSSPCPAIYYLRCDHLKNGKPMFGFPRIKNVSKEYTWKKQGFTTVIPKSDPCVRYITANCYLCGKGKNKNNMFAAFSGREPVLRMHAVMKIKTYETRGNNEKYQNDNYIDEGPFVLIHILKGGSHGNAT